MNYHFEDLHRYSLIFLFVLMGSCELESPQPHYVDWGAAFGGSYSGVGFAPVITQQIDLLGDKDGFGIGLTDGAMWTADTASTGWPIDYRINDPEFTDVYPADINGEIDYTHTWSYIFKADTNHLSAKFIIKTLGIQDGNTQVATSDTDIKLFLDGEELPGAFDDVDQFQYYAGQWVSNVGTIEIKIPNNLLYLLEDGEVVVHWEILQLGTSESIDAFAIDYAEIILDWDLKGFDYVPSVAHYMELGDRDSFGTGLENLYDWQPDSLGYLPVDNRDSEDPYFTDIYPAHVEGVIEYEYVFEAVTDSIVSAGFWFYAYGIQDGDQSNLAFNDTDIKLFIDGNEIEGAFDLINQMYWNGVQYLPAPSFITLSIPDDLLIYLADGNVDIRLEVYQYGTSDEFDNFAIDYTTLVYNTI